MEPPTGHPYPPAAKAALSYLLTMLQVHRTAADTFVAPPIPQPIGRLYGGQVLAGAVIASSRTVPDGRLPHSLHGYFLRPGSIDAELTYSIDVLHDGRSFSTRRALAIQHGRPILSLIASFQLDQPGVEHQNTMPNGIPGPEELPSSLDVVDALDEGIGGPRIRHGAFDLRHFPSDLYFGPGPRPTRHQAVWMRAVGQVPDDEILHRALLAYSCDQIMFEPILRRHELSWATPGLSVASLDHAMWWHRPARVDEWLVHVQSSPAAEGGRGLSTSTVFDRQGRLIATIAQQGMVRVPSGLLSRA